MPVQVTATPTLRRPDASMSLLNTLVDHPLDDGYAEAAARRAARGDPARPPQGSWLAMGAVAAAGLLLAVAAGTIRQDDAAAASERSSLLERVEAGEVVNDRLQQRIAALEAEVADLQGGALTWEDQGEALRRQLAALEVAAGAQAVQGPGVRVIVDDAPAGAADEVDDFGRVLDVDLQRLVNGLWNAGAEAVSINGQRVTALTAIRSASDVITVNYRPLVPPYEVAAVGDPRTLGARFAEGPGGQWFRTISTGQGIRFSVTTAEELTLPAASRTSLRYAEQGPA